MSNYTITASWGISHDLRMIGTCGGGSTNVIMARQIINGATVEQIKKVIIKSKKKEPGKITLDDAKLVQLGGPFEKIGEEDEVVGGRNQKVGSDNK